MVDSGEDNFKLDVDFVTGSNAGPSTPMNEGAEVEEDPILTAISRRDWDALRKLSLVSGGFGSRRTEAWYDGNTYWQSF